MIKKISGSLLAFSLFGIALWFFGNLYEGVVIAPNMLYDSVSKIRDWQDFFEITNPVYFYIPVSPLAVFVIVFLYFKTSRDNAALKRHLKYAIIFGLPAFGLGIVIITQINFKLFFGDIQKYTAVTHRLSVLWNCLNIARVLLLAPVLFHTFKACIEHSKKTS